MLLLQWIRCVPVVEYHHSRCLLCRVLVLAMVPCCAQQGMLRCHCSFTPCDHSVFASIVKFTKLKVFICFAMHMLVHDRLCAAAAEGAGQQRQAAALFSCCRPLICCMQAAKATVEVESGARVPEPVPAALVAPASGPAASSKGSPGTSVPATPQVRSTHNSPMSLCTQARERFHERGIPRRKEISNHLFAHFPSPADHTSSAWCFTYSPIQGIFG